LAIRRPHSSDRKLRRLQEKGAKEVEGAVGTAKAREATGQHSKRKEPAEFLLDEARQAASVAGGPSSTRGRVRDPRGDGGEESCCSASRG